MSNPAQRLTAIFSNLRADDPGAVDALVELYAPDIRFEDPLQKVEGRDAFRRMNEHLLRHCRSLRVEDVTALEDGARLVLTWTLIFKPKLGPEMRCAGATDIRFERDLVVYHRDYWDILGTVLSGFPGLEPLFKSIVARLF